MKLKKKNLILLAVPVLLTFQSIATAHWITDVNVLPSQPSMTDVITLHIRGDAPQGTSWVADANFLQDGTSLLLDLYIDMGNWDYLSHWSYSKEIGFLQPGNYLLTVQGFSANAPSNPPDIRTVEFTVTPEPGTFVLLVLGLPAFRRLTRRKHTQNSEHRTQ